MFGSVLRDGFHAGNDVDILVEFEPRPTTLQPGGMSLILRAPNIEVCHDE